MPPIRLIQRTLIMRTGCPRARTNRSSADTRTSTVAESRLAAFVHRCKILKYALTLKNRRPGRRTNCVSSDSQLIGTTRNTAQVIQVT